MADEPADAENLQNPAPSESESHEEQTADDGEDDGESTEGDDDEDAEEDEPKLKYARLTGSLGGVYRNGDATSCFLVAGDKMVRKFMVSDAGGSTDPS